MEDRGSHSLFTSNLGRDIKPFKKATIKVPFNQSEETNQERWRKLKRYQVKNPKWASLSHEASYEEDYLHLKALQKYKSLQLTSIAFEGRQVGATVGHFHGEIKHLEKISKHLRKLDFGAGAVSRRRFRDMKRWIVKQKNLSDLSFVPYWFPAKDESDVEDWQQSGCNTTGVTPLIHLLHAQIEKLTLFGIAREDLKDRLDFKRMKRLEHFALKAAFRPESCDGEPEEFGDIHLEFIKKALASKTLKILTLYCQCDVTPKDFWESLKELLTPLKRHLIVHVKIDYRYSFGNTNEWFKKIFAKIPANIKVTYAVNENSYFLSLPQGLEVKGEDDGKSDDFEESEEDDDDDDDGENSADEDQKDDE